MKLATDEPIDMGMTVTVNRFSTFPCRNDNGADISCISRQLKKLPTTSYQIIPLPHMRNELFIKDAEATIQEATTLDLTVNTLSGQVILRQVTVYIVEEEMSEFIIGKRTLTKLGIDVDRLMQNLAGKEFNLDDEQTHIRNALPPEIHVGQDTSDEVLVELEKRLAECSLQGATQLQIAAMRKLVMKHRDVFRTKFGADPPVKIEPLQIKLKPGAQLPKMKPRRSNPLKNEFLRRRTAELIKYNLIYRNTQRARFISWIR